MLNVIIVEDEELSLEMLSNIITKNFPDLNVTGSFNSPLDAIEFLKSNHTDIMIADIKMPEMSGIALSEFVTKNFPFVKIILISAYQDFDAARQALNSNVVSYILKPVTIEKLSSAVGIISEMINKNKRFLFFSSDTLYKKRAIFANEVIQKGMSRSEIEESMNELHININHKNCYSSILKCKITDFENYIKNIWMHDENAFHSAINNILNANNNENCFGIIFDWNFDTFSCLYLVDVNYKNFFDENIKKLQQLFQQILKSNTTFEVISTFSSVYSISDIKKSNVLQNKLIEKIFNLDKEYSITYEEISSQFKSTEDLYTFCEKLAANSINLINSVFFEKENHNLYDYLSIKEENDFINYIISTSDIIQKYKKNKQQIELYNKTVAYIEENYMNEITLEEIASHIGFSPWFFCKFFKKHSGYTFTDYLNKLRIKKAIEILEQEPYTKISSICYKVGFPTISNFYKKFKAYTGLAPNQYVNSKKDGK